MDWDDDLLRLFGISRSVLPSAGPTVGRHGLAALAAGEVPLEVLIGDQNAVVYAWGRPREDVIYVNVGTGAFALRPTGRQDLRIAGLLPGVACRDATSTARLVEGTVNGAGSAVGWLQERLGCGDLGERLHEWLRRPGEPPLFLNTVSGLGSPWWRTDLAPRFVGDGEPAMLAVAVIESIVFLLQANVERLATAGGPPIGIRIGGGNARFDGLCRRLADLARLPVERAAHADATARGVAFLLAGRPAEWSPPGPVDRFVPRDDPALEKRYRRWRDALEEALATGG